MSTVQEILNIVDKINNDIKMPEHSILNISEITCSLDVIKKFLETKEHLIIFDKIEDLGLSKQFVTFSKGFVKKLNENLEIISRLNNNEVERYKEILYHFVNFEIVTFKILYRISYTGKTLLILGANGTGKTSFAEQLRKSTQNIRVIQAFKNLYYYDSVIYAPLNTQIKDFDKIAEQSSYEKAHRGYKNSQDLLINYFSPMMSKLIISIINEHIETAIEYKRTDVKKPSVYEKLISIFQYIFPNIEISIDSTLKILNAKNRNNENSYDINSLSDGERAAIFYIGTILLAPENAYIVVDEPENHLNPAIYNKLWDKLISVRNDCQFIFISHTTDFVIARKGYEIIWFKNFVYPSTFDFEFVGEDIEFIDPHILVEVIGSQKDVLFCEGEKNGLDYNIYSILFSDSYNIIPVGSCENVINFTKSFNQAPKMATKGYFGIVDNDNLSEEKIQEYISSNIYILSVNEIEMLLIDEEIFKNTLGRIFEIKPIECQKKFDKFLKDFFDLISKRKEAIVNIKIKMELDSYIEHKKIENYKNIESVKQNIKTFFNDIDLDLLYSKYEKIIDDSLQNKEYKILLKFCNLKGEIINGLGNKYIQRYAENVIKTIAINETIQHHIISEYIKMSK